MADDQILATCLACAATAPEVILATSDFPMYAKARSLGLNAVLLEDYADLLEPTTRRERAELKDKWRRVETANNLWALCRRGLAFLNSSLVRRMVLPVVETNDPPGIAAILQQWRSLEVEWSQNVNLPDIFKAIFGLDPVAPVNYAVTQLTVPGKPWAFGVTYQEQQPTHRPESEAERALRIKKEQELAYQREEFLMDVLVSGLERVREYMLDLIDEDVPLG